MEIQKLRYRLAPGVRIGCSSRTVHADSAEARHLEQQLRNLLFKGESSSLIVCGAQASGKTTVRQSHSLL